MRRHPRAQYRRLPEPGKTYRFVHARKGAFIATFLGYVGEYWHVTIATDLPGQGRFARAKIRDKKGRKILPPTVEKYLRPELLTEVEPHGVD